MRLLLLFFLFIFSYNLSSQVLTNNSKTIFEKTDGLETSTYHETIAFYTGLAKKYPTVAIDSVGETDSGKPLHVITLNNNEVFDFAAIRASNKRILLINNGIHPGESDGIDATMLLFRDFANGTLPLPKKTVLVTIPIYNIGGSLNRNATTRTNQNGPKTYGFRGNARNYDLNRDFIKCDTKNARTFTTIFHIIKPDVFIDNHVSNGADYQYTLTHLFTQHNKLGGNLGTYIQNEMLPKLKKKLAEKAWDITPYVNVFNQVPENGFSQFLDSPRYSTGYTTLWNTLGMMVETHMLKPYKQRVKGTYELIKSMVDIVEEDAEAIALLRKNHFKSYLKKEHYALDWEIDSTQQSTLDFKGFEAENKTSSITGLPRLKYDRNKPFNKTISYLNYFKPSIEVKIPQAYIVPQGWWHVIDLLKLNDVKMIPFKRDTTIGVESYKIKSYKTRNAAYEGHYQHYDTEINSEKESVHFRKGDYLILTDQYALRYLLETLEPQAPDSFFNWNFFDTILQQKEGFSPYVWEDKALSLLQDNADLKLEFETKKSTDIKFAKNWYAQLDWIHKHSEYYEKAHLQYPIYRILK